MYMKKFFIAAACAACLAVMGCASMEWRAAPQAPIIKELGSVKSLGILSFTPVLPANRHILVKVDKTFYVATELDGVQNKVAMLYIAPDAVSAFFVNKANLAALCRDTGVAMIGGKEALDYPVSKGFTISRVMGQPLTPESGGAGIAGYTAVTAITEVLDRQKVTAQDIVGLGAKYGVDAVLGLEPHVYGEIGQVSPLLSSSKFGKDVPVGTFILNAHVDYEYALYDARTGKKITDSFDMRAPYDTLSNPDDDITDLGLRDVKTVSSFLGGSRYLELFGEPVKRALIPYLTLFRSCYVATLQEVEK